MMEIAIAKMKYDGDKPELLAHQGNRSIDKSKFVEDTDN